MENLIRISHSLSLDKGIPTQIKILPLGLVKSQKGDFLVDNESFEAILNRFQNRKVDIPIDYEHQTLQDVQAPAAGWIKSLVLKADGIYAQVEWTAKANEYLTNKEYRYLSPVINVRDSDHKALTLHSVALTNTPAIDGMTAIVNSTASANNEADDPAGASTDPVDSKLDDLIKELKRLLGLSADVTPDELKQSIVSLMENQTAYKLKADAMRFDAYQKNVQDTVLEAMHAGKITPAQKEWATTLALKDLDGFKAFVSASPMVVPLGEIVADSGLERNSRSDAHRMMGLSEEDVRRYGGKDRER